MSTHHAGLRIDVPPVSRKNSRLFMILTIVFMTDSPGCLCTQLRPSIPAQRMTTGPKAAERPTGLPRCRRDAAPTLGELGVVRRWDGLCCETRTRGGRSGRRRQIPAAAFDARPDAIGPMQRLRARAWRRNKTEVSTTAT